MASREIKPSISLTGFEMSVSTANYRSLTNAFVRSGQSIHSGRGSTLWVILEYCRDQQIPYTLKAMPGMGYLVEIDDIQSQQTPGGE